MNLGDFDRTCPSEMALLPSLRVATRMLEEHGAEEALRRARGFAAGNVEGGWGRRSWDFSARVVELLSVPGEELEEAADDRSLPQFLQHVAPLPPLPPRGERRPVAARKVKPKPRQAQMSLLDLLEES